MPNNVRSPAYAIHRLSFYLPSMAQEGVSGHEQFLKFQSKCHRAPSLLKSAPAPIASHHGGEHTHRELEVKPVGQTPGIHTASPFGIKKSPNGGVV